jgi:transcriptional regulator with XRE-family HTH domain
VILFITDKTLGEINMEGYNKDKVSARLREMRERAEWSQNEMAQKLNDLIGYNSIYSVMNLDGETGKQTVSQLERTARGLTVDMAFAYAHIFNVSLDYVFGRTDNWQPENKSVKELIGIPDEAIKTLTKIKALAQLHEKYQRFTHEIDKLTRIYKEIRNDKSKEPQVLEIGIEINKLEDERNVLEAEMQDATDPCEGYFKPPHWKAPITCRRAWQRLHTIGALLSLEEGEQALDAIGEYFYVGDLTDGLIRYSDGTLDRSLDKEEIAAFKLLGVQKSLAKAWEILNPPVKR